MLVSWLLDFVLSFERGFFAEFGPSRFGACREEEAPNGNSENKFSNFAFREC